MIASLYAGISGLSAQATAMTVIGDNIANVNTTAFKSNSSHFANILSNSLGGESATSGVGRGVEFWGASAQWTQGSLENSANSTDLAINGKGFFMVEDLTGSRFYTRAGSFSFDKEGYLVNPDGLKLQGYQLERQRQYRQHHGHLCPRRAHLAALGHDRVQLRHQPELDRGRGRHVHHLADRLRLARQRRSHDAHLHPAGGRPDLGRDRLDPDHGRHGRDLRRGRQHEHRLRRYRRHDHPRRRCHGLAWL